MIFRKVSIVFSTITFKNINPSHLDLEQIEKIKFWFSHFFVVPQKVLWRPLSPQK